MVQITVEVPAPLVGDVYIAVGKVFEAGRDEWDTEAAQADSGPTGGDDEPADES